MGGLAVALILGLAVALLFMRRPPRPREAALPEPEVELGPLPGADPSRAIAVTTPAVIEDQAERWPCPACASQVRCDNHRVEIHAGQRLRVADVRCPRCGLVRSIYFVLRPGPASTRA